LLLLWEPRETIFRTGGKFCAGAGSPFAGTDRPFFFGQHRRRGLSIRFRLRGPVDAVLAQPSRAQAALLGALLGCLLLAKFNSLHSFCCSWSWFLCSLPEKSSFTQAASSGVACRRIPHRLHCGLGRILLPHLEGDLRDQMVTIHFSGYTKLLQYEMPTLKLCHHFLRRVSG